MRTRPLPLAILATVVAAGLVLAVVPPARARRERAEAGVALAVARRTADPAGAEALTGRDCHGDDVVRCVHVRTGVDEAAADVAAKLASASGRQPAVRCETAYAAARLCSVRVLTASDHGVHVSVSAHRTEKGAPDGARYSVSSF
jgi:hypothetical protein